MRDVPPSQDALRRSGACVLVARQTPQTDVKRGRGRELRGDGAGGDERKRAEPAHEAGIFETAVIMLCTRSRWAMAFFSPGPPRAEFRNEVRMACRTP